MWGTVGSGCENGVFEGVASGETEENNMKTLPVNQVVCGDAFQVLEGFPEKSIDMVMFSPPYWGLRDYGVDGQMGLEAHPNLWIQKMVKLCQMLKRVLKRQGSLYLNVGDTYFSQGGLSKHEHLEKAKVGNTRRGIQKGIRYHVNTSNLQDGKWLQPKQLLLMPSRLAIALQDDGWILRNDIVWHKPNHMPSSVKDRLTNSWEHIFHFCKAKENRRYKEIFKETRPELSEVDKAWLACAIDTDGCISISRQKQENFGTFQYGAYVIFTNTNKKIIDYFHSKVKCGAITQRRHLKSGKIAYLLRLTNNNAYWLLYQIYPKLLVKQEQAKAMLYLSKIKRPKGQKQKKLSSKELEARDKVWRTIKELNQGKITETDFPEPSIPLKYSGCERYFYDLDAIRKPHKITSLQRFKRNFNTIQKKDETGKVMAQGINTMLIEKGGKPHPLGKNPSDTITTFDKEWREGKEQIYGDDDKGARRSRVRAFMDSKPNIPHVFGKNPSDFWRVNTQPFKGAHFAVYPEKLCERPIKSSCPLQICKACGKPRKRKTRISYTAASKRKGWSKKPFTRREKEEKTNKIGYRPIMMYSAIHETVGFSDCGCGAGFEPGIVLDPMCGSGTTLVVAHKLGRNWIGIELNKDYVELAKKRLESVGAYSTKLEEYELCVGEEP